MLRLCLDLKETAKLFSRVAGQFAFLPAMHETSHYSASLPALAIVIF